MSSKCLALAVIVAASVALTGCGGAAYDGASSTRMQSTGAASDCTGHSGNSAIAACHPDEPSVQEACPDNSGGQEYAAPDEACLAAVRALSN
jgi:hypothetical protein